MHTAFAVVALLCCATLGVHAADSPLQPLEPLAPLQSQSSSPLPQLDGEHPVNARRERGSGKGASSDLLLISSTEEVKLADSLFYSDELQVSFRVNRAEMSDSAALVRFVSNCLLPATLDKGWHLDRIVIRGAASPEGPWENNRRLAQKRAQALSTRLAQLLPAALADNDSLLVETQVVEDYQRLLYLLHEASDSLEEVVSDVLSEESGDEKRIKSRLMSHDNGRTWRYLLKRYFPQLRSARVLFVMTPPNAEAVAQFRSDMHDGELSRRYASTESPLQPLEPLQFQSSAPAEESPSSLDPLESLEPLEPIESLDSLDSQESSSSASSPLPQLDGEHPVNARRERGSGKGASQTSSPLPQLDGEHPVNARRERGLGKGASQTSSPLPQSGKGASLHPESSAWRMIGICLIVALLLLLLLVAFLLHRIKQLREEIDEFAQMARRPSVMSSMPRVADVPQTPVAPSVPESAELPDSQPSSVPATPVSAAPAATAPVAAAPAAPAEPAPAAIAPVSAAPAETSAEPAPAEDVLAPAAAAVAETSAEPAPAAEVPSSLESIDTLEPLDTLESLQPQTSSPLPQLGKGPGKGASASSPLPQLDGEHPVNARRERGPEKGASDALLELARAFVEANMSREDFSPEELAAHLGLSESLLNRRIRKFTGDTAKRYILSLRMQRAAELLSTTDMSVRDIALACGFSDQSYFARMVKQCTGRTPSQHRTEKAPAEPLIEGIFDGLPE